MIATHHRRAAIGRKAGVSRAVAVFVSALCLAGQIATAAHEAAERHVRCAEHGEIAHVPTAFDAAAIVPPGQQAGWTADGLGEAVGHDHCGFVAAAKRRESRPILLVQAAPQPAPPPRPAPPPALAPQTDRILLSAPKIAPPAAVAPALRG